MTVQERMERVRAILEEPVSMGRFIEPIRVGSLKNRGACGVVTGFSFGLNNLSYRGIWLSTFEDIRVVVDGEVVPTGEMVLSLKGMKFLIRDLGGHSEVFWGAEDSCEVIIYRLGGLPEGKHRISIDLMRRNDFGHTVGNGEEGYEEAMEFLNPMTVHGEAEMEVSKAWEV